MVAEETIIINYESSNNPKGLKKLRKLLLSRTNSYKYPLEYSIIHSMQVVSNFSLQWSSILFEPRPY